ncbi:hypothetical protein HK097_006337, partial [Rhizophlyctis rosea]
MADYYRGATGTLAFLGGIGGPCHVISTSSKPDDDSSKLYFLAKWFTRVWTLQEALLSTNLVFYRGRNAETGENETSSAVDVLTELGSICADMACNLSDGDWHRLSAAARVLSSSRGVNKLSPRYLFEIVSHRECTVEEDKVYGLLGMLPTTRPVSVKYGIGLGRALWNVFEALRPEQAAEALELTAWGRDVGCFLPYLKTPLVSRKGFEGRFVDVCTDADSKALMIRKCFVWEKHRMEPYEGGNSLLIPEGATDFGEDIDEDDDDDAFHQEHNNNFRLRTAALIAEALESHGEAFSAKNLSTCMESLNLQTTFEW